MILVVSDKQRWNFITPSWLFALYSEYEEIGHIIEPLLEMSRHQIPRLQVQTLTIVFHTESVVVIPPLDRVLKRVARIALSRRSLSTTFFRRLISDGRRPLGLRFSFGT